MADLMGISPPTKCPFSLLRVLGPSITAEIPSLAGDLFSLPRASKKRPRKRTNSPHNSLGGGGFGPIRYGMMQVTVLAIFRYLWVEEIL